jgi:FkbM family methyltransferase
MPMNESQVAILFERLLRLEMGNLLPAFGEKSDKGPSTLRMEHVEKSFYELVKILEIDLFLEIGACWAEASRKVKKYHRPNCQIVAVEANPETFQKAIEKFDFANLGIDYINYAIGDHTGHIEIKVPIIDDREHSSSGSIFESSKLVSSQRVFQVNSMTLDELAETSNSQSSERIAMWIDCEGAAFEVFNFGKMALEKTCCIYVELQDGNVWENAKSSNAVTALLLEHGFIPIARDRQQANVYNALFLHHDYYEDVFPRIVKPLLVAPQ